MARKRRMIHPDIWTDRRFAVLNEGEQIFFVALFSQADDEGRLIWDAMEMKLRCFPASANSFEIFEKRKERIVEAGLAHQWEADGRVYLLLPGWYNTQTLDHPAISKIPDPPDLSTNCALLEYSRSLAKIRENSRKGSKPQETSGDVGKVPAKISESKGSEDKRNDLAPDFGNLESDVAAFIANSAKENKTGRISDGKESRLRAELAEARSEFPDVFADALRETNQRGVPEINYLRKVAKSRLRRGGLSAVPPSKRELHGYLNGEKFQVGSLGEAPNGWTDVPPQGKKMADLWPEHKNYGTDYEAA